MTKILMVYPEFPETFWSFKYAVEFVGKAACNPPLGLVTIAAMLPEKFEVKIIDMNVTKLLDSDIDWADMVFLSAMDVQRESAHQVASRIKTKGKMIVAGGPLFPGEYQDFPEIDVFVLNEAEITLPQFLQDLEIGKTKKLYSTKEFADITKTPVPAWELLDLEKYDSMNIQFSRGCPFNCDFCNITALLGRKPRLKTTQQIISELDKLYELGWRRNIFFVDDNFIGNKKILKEEILPALIQWRKGKQGFLFTTEASINLADDEELMTLMSAAGFVSVFIGIETPANDSLTECHKSQNQNRDLISSVRRLQRHGMQVMGGFIVGFDNDTSEIFDRQVDFIQESGIVTAMVGLLQAPYGTTLYERMQREGRLIKAMSGDNADGTTNIVPKMDASILLAGYRSILERIYSPAYFYQRIRTLLKEFQPVHAPVTMHFAEISAFLKSIWRLGILGKERTEFWKLIRWVLSHFPEKLPLAITFAIYGYHFRMINERNFA